MKIPVSPCTLKLNEVEFLQGLAVQTAVSSLIMRNPLGNHTQHLLPFLTSLLSNEKVLNCVVLSFSFSNAINGPRDILVVKD